MRIFLFYFLNKNVALINKELFFQITDMTDEIQHVFDSFLSKTLWMDEATKILSKQKVNNDYSSISG